ncbi:HNH endonuclease signature motif containing protein [Muricauda sp. 81s02]|uniref:HNH endonuclease signature motif containing protein n=2 Tax=Flagellimonas okinawensis TaxID=3031324 RepID=A0ABT5XRK5_9FLAO|nr:HNH endonuclease signature motif containing protein [[Muricauda] okinawensis]
MEAYQSTCLVTGVRLENVLEAAHIKPIKHKGDDNIFNGICMRADIHTLFDSNHLKILPSGEIKLTSEANRKENYEHLPSKVVLPDFVDRQQLDWRIKYY